MPVTKKFPIFSKAVYALLLLVAVAAIYGQFLWNPIVFDDQQFFMLGNDALKHYRSFSPFELRWLPMATIAWTAHGIGLELIWFRVENLLLHATTGIALFFFLHCLFDLALKKIPGEPARLPHAWTAFFGALLFVWHPVAVYGAGYLIERTIVMATLFSLLALYAYIRGLTEERPRWLWGSVALYYLAVFSKEHVVMLPAVMLALTVLLAQPSPALWQRLWRIYAACTLIALFVVLQKVGLLGTVYEITAPDMLGEIKVEHAYPLSILTQCLLFFKYWFLWLAPNPAWTSVDMREPFANSNLPLYLLALFAFLLYGLLALRLLFKRGAMGLLGFALLFPWLLFMTEFSSVRIQESFVLYRSYLWAVGGFALLPLIVWKFTARGAMLMLAITCLFMVPLAMERLSTFSHTLLLWDDAEKLVRGRSDLPGEYRIYYNRGTEFIKIDQYDRAISDLKRSIELFADQPPAYGNLGWAYLKKGEMEQSVLAYNKAIQTNDDRKYPPHPKYHLGRATAHEALKNWAAASADYKIACKIVNKGCDKTSLPLIATSPKSH
ncbi:MAG: tetratricopeptide repeat protein [Gallionella sp.]|nr:tetratricopeptide repeat protein [Gallionella sp.]